jgi:hypothetical protein
MGRSGCLDIPVTEITVVLVVLGHPGELAVAIGARVHRSSIMIGKVLNLRINLRLIWQ